MVSGIQLIKGVLSGNPSGGFSPAGGNFSDSGNDVEAMIRQRELVLLYQFWLEKKTERGSIPSRADISPRDLGRLLPHIALVDVHEQEGTPEFTFRLCGTQIAEDCGTDLTGKTWHDYPNAGKVIERARKLVRDLEPYYACNIQAKWAPKSFHHYSVLALPLSADGTNANMILYGVIFHPDLN